MITCPHCSKELPKGGSAKTHIRFCGRDWKADFWKKVDINGPTECWPWMASRKPRGYGHFVVMKKDHNAHRLAYELQRGPIPSGMEVMHRCDNPPCVNPAHLFVGDHGDNMRDMLRKERRSTERLKASQVREVRKLLGTMPQKEIAEMFNVKEGVISGIKNRQSYRFVE